MEPAPTECPHGSRTDAAGAASVTLSVIAPCLNEEANVDALVERTLGVFDRLSIRAELILVDDGSGDGTWERMRLRAGNDGRVRIAQHLSNQGMVRAWQTGLSIAHGELVCLIDADLQNRPEDIPRLYERFARGDADVVQGVRVFENPPWIRLMISRGLNALLNLAFGMRARDNKSGFILCRRVALFQVLRHRFRYRYYQSFLGPAAKLRGFRIAEIDTAHDPRRAGTSFLPRVPFGVILRLLWETLKYRVEAWCERPRDRRLAGRRATIAEHAPDSPVRSTTGTVLGSHRHQRRGRDSAALALGHP